MDLDCKTCGKSFKFQSSLSRHGRIHKALHVMCDCGLSFSRQDSLKRHQLMPQSCRAFKQAYVPGTLKSDNSSKTEDPQVNTVSDISYKQIRGDFWNAEYLGFQVVMIKDTGYINATKMCSSGGKNYCDWARLKCSHELIQAVKNDMESENTHDTFASTLQNGNVQICTLPSPPCKFVQTMNSTDYERLISGT